jgi:hypothetical protein
MKKRSLLITGIMLLSACKQGKEQKTNLSIFGTHFSKESSTAKKARNNSYQMLLTEKAAIPISEKERVLETSKRLQLLEALLSKAAIVNEFIYNEQLALLNYKKANKKGLRNDGDDFVFDFIDFHGQLKKHVVDLQTLKGLIDNFKSAVGSAKQHVALKTQGHLDTHSAAYFFDKNKYELNTDPHEKLIILEEMESDFNQYAQAIVAELAQSDAEQLNLKK